MLFHGSNNVTDTIKQRSVELWKLCSGYFLRQACQTRGPQICMVLAVHVVVFIKLPCPYYFHCNEMHSQKSWKIKHKEYFTFLGFAALQNIQKWRTGEVMWPYMLGPNMSIWISDLPRELFEVWQACCRVKTAGLGNTWAYNLVRLNVMTFLRSASLPIRSTFCKNKQICWRIVFTSPWGRQSINTPGVS